MTLKVDLSALDALDGALEAARREFPEEARDMMEQYVPQRTGALRGHTVVSEDAVDYTEDYASFVHEMPEGFDYSTPGTSGRWEQKLEEERIYDIEQWLASRIEGAL